MSAHDDSGPVYPVVSSVLPEGITLRDHMAIEAMKVLMADADSLRTSATQMGLSLSVVIAEFSYHQADAMLKARKGGSA